jgi:hypothetical protein
MLADQANPVYDKPFNCLVKFKHHLKQQPDPADKPVFLVDGFSRGTRIITNDQAGTSAHNLHAPLTVGFPDHQPVTRLAGIDHGGFSSAEAT